MSEDRIVPDRKTPDSPTTAKYRKMLLEHEAARDAAEESNHPVANPQTFDDSQFYDDLADKDTSPAAEQEEQPTDNQPEPETPAPKDDDPYKPRFDKTKGLWYVRLDLGDGSGVQEFKDKNKTGLIRQFAKAQAEATKKIRELNKQRRQSVKPETAPTPRSFDVKPLTAEEKFLIQQELNNNPESAIARMLQATVGANPTEIREILGKILQTQHQQEQVAVLQQFARSHRELLTADGNSFHEQNDKLFTEYFQKNNLALTPQNLEMAYEELDEAGFLQKNDNERQTPTTVPSQRNRIVTPEPPVAPRKRVGAALSSRNLAPSAVLDDDEDTSPAPRRLTDEQLRRLPLGERRRIVNGYVEEDQRRGR